MKKPADIRDRSLHNARGQTRYAGCRSPDSGKLLVLEKAKRELDESNAQLQDSNEKLIVLATQDALTGLNNRRVFEETLYKEFKRGAREKTPLSIIIMDIDHFKQYNDNYGHTKGDDCLRQIAQAIADCATRPGDMAARYGGEEFIMVLPNTDRGGTQIIAQNILDKIKSLNIPHEYSSCANHVTISMGCIINLNYEFIDAEKLVTLADKGLYYVKENGRNGFNDITHPVDL